MPTNIEDIMKNAQVADFKERMFEDDLENLSLSVDDSSDSFRFQVSSVNDSQLSYSEHHGSDGSGQVKSAIKSAKDFIESDNFITIVNDKVTVNGARKNLDILCSTSQHHAVHCVEDQALIKGRICTVDLILMASKDMPLTEVFESTLKSIVQARRNIPFRRVGTGPAVHICLAWLSHAAQCSICDLVPRGEIFLHAERYIHERLEQEQLPAVPRKDRTELAIFQICRVLDVLSVCDLRSQSPVDRSILIYAICRLVLDKSSCCTMQHRASIAVENILNASSLKKRATLVEFSNIFPLISDDIKNLQLCHEIIRQSNVDPSCCLSLFCSVLIHISERAECEPAGLDSISEEEFVDSNLGVIIDVLEDAMDICENDEKKRCVVIVMLDTSFQPLLYNMLIEKRRQQFVDVLQRLKCDLGANVNPNGVLTYRLLRNLMDRFQIQSSVATSDLSVI